MIAQSRDDIFCNHVLKPTVFVQRHLGPLTSSLLSESCSLFIASSCRHKCYVGVAVLWLQNHSDKKSTIRAATNISQIESMWFSAMEGPMDVESKPGDKILSNVGYECKQSLLKRADGSAFFKQGNAEVLAAVYGPVEVRISKEMINRATVECNFRTKSGLPGCEEKLVERMIRNSCDSIILSTQNPRTAISIIIQVINDADELVSCALNAAFMTLMNAGIPLSCMAGAVSCFVLEDGSISLNTSNCNDKEKIAGFTFVFESTNLGIISSSTQGKFTIDQYFSCLAASKEAVKSVFAFQRKSFKRSLSLEKRH